MTYPHPMDDKTGFELEEGEDFFDDFGRWQMANIDRLMRLSMIERVNLFNIEKTTRTA